MEGWFSVNSFVIVQVCIVTLENGEQIQAQTANGKWRDMAGKPINPVLFKTINTTITDYLVKWA